MRDVSRKAVKRRSEHVLRQAKLLKSMEASSRYKTGYKPPREFSSENVEARRDILLSCMIHAHVAELVNSQRVTSVARERNKQTIDMLRQQCRDKSHKRYTLGSFSTGGCVDTIAALKAGLRPIWGTEVCEKKRAMWVDLTQSADLGDTFSVDWSQHTTPNIIASGQTCIDYSSSGPRLGSAGDTGWVCRASETDTYY